MDGQFNEKYLRKCHKRLRELGAPLENWNCREVVDGETADFICELCSCQKVRYIHVMEHPEYNGELNVGCICAGYMEGDLIAARERDDAARRKSSRRANFRKRSGRSKAKTDGEQNTSAAVWLLNGRSSAGGIFTKSRLIPTATSGGKTAALKHWKTPSWWYLN